MIGQIVEPAVMPRLLSSGFEIETAANCWGPLRDSSDVVGDVDELRHRMRTDGYLYLPGYLDREQVLSARRVITDKLAADEFLAPGSDAMDAVARPGLQLKFKPDLADDNEPLDALLYNGRMMDFYERFLGDEVRHFDYTWMRAVGPGKGTAPHEDVVFMGRGTKQVYTAWTPLGDISYQLGGLIVLEHSHAIEEIRQTYGTKDVDEYCENEADAALFRSGEKWWNGAIAENPVLLRQTLQRRWLGAEFRAGDLLTFTLFTLHASLDNQTDRIRLSSDTRYQLASEPIDERWVGPNPIGHSTAGKRGRIC